jgi:hypothetical protein
LCFEFDYRVLSGRYRIITFCGSETLIDREWHLALEMSTSRMAHDDRERERHLQNNNTTKPEQLMLSKTDSSI